MILCCGEALIDMLPRPLPDGKVAFAPYAGGAVFNTAVALGRLGVQTGLFSGLSTDMFGNFLVDALSASGVGTTLAVRSPRPTTLAFVELVDGQARYAFYDENTAGRMLCTNDLPELPDDVHAIFFGGISLVAEPCGTAYEAMMLRNAGKAVTMIDPNIRPGFITDEVAYRGRLARMMAAADIVKLSDEDLHWLSGPGDIEKLARDLVATGPRVVFITEGAKGAHGFTRRNATFVPARKVAVADTVGAGDTFNAGVLAGLSRLDMLHKDAINDISSPQLNEALTLGIRAAAITVSRPGANPPWLAEIT
jgi:fructokinase